ncbi:coil containing protein [Vibrio phage 1.161.O._10N.261.48.C5]|nr:coil containing protein [Vibrio phage 1.161.O._10N.261.48.C5]
MAEVKRKAGRPKGTDKQAMLAKRMDEAELKMKELEVVLATRVTAAHEKLVTEFEEHIAFISRVARGEEKGATMSNRIKCAEMMIKRVDELKDKLEMEEVDANSLEMDDPLGEGGDGSAEGHDENVIQFG